MKFSVITLFPDFIQQGAQLGVVGQAIAQEKIQLEVMTPRTWTTDLHKTIDDRPFGGGDGMVMMAEPLSQCLEELLKSSPSFISHEQVENNKTEFKISDLKSGTTLKLDSNHSSIPRRIYLSPQGKKLDHNLVMELSHEKHLLLLCGRYAGVDQRLLNHYQFEEISIGDYVLSGGELGALVLIDAIGRQLEGVLGHEVSAREDSFAKDGLLEAPGFTRPREWKGSSVPDFLLSGNHGQIIEDRWILSVLITFKKRPDLFEVYISKASEKKKVWIKSLERVKIFSDNSLAALGIERSHIETFEKELLCLKII